MTPAAPPLLVDDGHSHGPRQESQDGPGDGRLLRHDLAPHYPALRRIRTRAELQRSALYAEIRTQLEQVLGAVERVDVPASTARARSLRAVAWNIQRGRDFAGLCRALREDPLLREADVLLLSEVDNGLGRSGNRHVARELAAHLGMSYAFGVSYLTLEDDFGENPEAQENTLALAGSAILSRVPLGRVACVDLPELRDKFSSSEKRLGHKRALWAELLLADGPLVIGQCHLDSNASPAQRAAQLRALLQAMEASGVPRLVLGGDLNTTTYDASATLPLLRDLMHKLFVTGFRQTVDGYMTPERRYERPIFDLLRERGFALEGWNDRARGTIQYDLNSPYAIDKVKKKVGRLLTWLLRRRLRPWNGVVQARLDWFCGRGLQPVNAAVVNPRCSQGPQGEPDAGVPVSDHAAIVVDIRCP